MSDLDLKSVNKEPFDGRKYFRAIPRSPLEDLCILKVEQTDFRVLTQPFIRKSYFKFNNVGLRNSCALNKRSIIYKYNIDDIQALKLVNIDKKITLQDLSTIITNFPFVTHLVLKKLSFNPEITASHLKEVFPRLEYIHFQS